MSSARARCSSRGVRCCQPSGSNSCSCDCWRSVTCERSVSLYANIEISVCICIASVEALNVSAVLPLDANESRRMIVLSVSVRSCSGVLPARTPGAKKRTSTNGSLSVRIVASACRVGWSDSVIGATNSRCTSRKRSPLACSESVTGCQDLAGAGTAVGR